VGYNFTLTRFVAVIKIIQILKFTFSHLLVRAFFFYFWTLITVINPGKNPTEAEIEEVLKEFGK